MVQALNDVQVKEMFPVLYRIFWLNEKPSQTITPPETVKPSDSRRGDRRPDESIHDYLTRKGIKCWCKDCR